jgi:hypothetical protein
LVRTVQDEDFCWALINVSFNHWVPEAMELLVKIRDNIKKFNP